MLVVLETGTTMVGGFKNIFQEFSMVMSVWPPDSVVTESLELHISSKFDICQIWTSSVFSVNIHPSYGGLVGQPLDLTAATASSSSSPPPSLSPPPPPPPLPPPLLCSLLRVAATVRERPRAAAEAKKRRQSSSNRWRSRTLPSHHPSPHQTPNNPLFVEILPSQPPPFSFSSLFNPHLVRTEIVEMPIWPQREKI